MVRAIESSKKAQYISEMNLMCSKHRSNIQLNDGDWENHLIDNKWSYRDYETHPIKQFLRNKMVDMKSPSPIRLFRYMRGDRLFQVIGESRVQMSSMASMHENDSEEYEEYFRVVGANYDRAKIQKYKEDTFILCFTHDYRNDRMWEEYTKFAGVCVEFEIEQLPYKDSWIWEMRKTHYNDEPSFEFLREIVDVFLKKYSINLVFPTHKFAQFYKRDSYSWEKETRICIQREDMQLFKKPFDELFSVLPIEEQSYPGRTKRRYINAPLNNCLFRVAICKVYLGKKFDSVANSSLVKELTKQRITFQQM